MLRVKRVLATLVCMLCLGMVFCQTAFAYEYDTDGVDYKKFYGKGVTINVYNWGQYISDGGEEGSMDVVAEFEELTGIKVNYTNYATNEEMYAKLKSGGNKYDIIIPSDYMIGKLIEEGLLAKLNYDNIPNYKYIDKTYTDQPYDPTSEYSVPYTFGYVGILYNTNVVTEPVDSWDILWDKDYTGDILMFNNFRDAFGIALTKLGYSANTTSEEQLREAADLLKEQKSVIQAYVMDEIFDKMGSGEAAIAPYYAGDYLLIAEDNPDVAFCYPKEGTNFFIDAVCIPKECNNKEAAELFINFLCDPQVAYENFEYIYYATPNTGAMELMSEEEKTNPIFFPDAEYLKKCFVFETQDADTAKTEQELWTEVLSENSTSSKWTIPVFVVICLGLSAFINVRRYYIKKRSRY